MTTLPPGSTPLYNHPLPLIEAWLSDKGCRQDQSDPSAWYINQAAWQAELVMGAEEIHIRYLADDQGKKEVQRSFPYSLSRQDIEDAIFTGP